MVLRVDHRIQYCRHDEDGSCVIFVAMSGNGRDSDLSSIVHFHAYSCGYVQIRETAGKHAVQRLPGGSHFVRARPPCRVRSQLNLEWWAKLAGSHHKGTQWNTGIRTSPYCGFFPRGNFRSLDKSDAGFDGHVLPRPKAKGGRLQAVQVMDIGSPDNKVTQMQRQIDSAWRQYGKRPADSVTARF